jgi:hypothetical protein
MKLWLQAERRAEFHLGGTLTECMAMTRGRMQEGDVPPLVRSAKSNNAGKIKVLKYTVNEVHALGFTSACAMSTRALHKSFVTQS